MSWLYDTWRKMNCGYLEIKKGADLIFSSGWRGWGKGKKADLWMGEGVEAMKMEEINQWYHLHGSLANHRPQRFISLWGSFCCHNKTNPPNHITQTHTGIAHLTYKPVTFRRALCHQKSHSAVFVCVESSIICAMYSRCNLTACCPSVFIGATAVFLLCVQSDIIKSW